MQIVNPQEIVIRLPEHIDIEKLLFWHHCPCDQEKKKGICSLLNIESVKNQRVIDVFQKLKNLPLEKEFPQIKSYRDLGVDEIYSRVDREGNRITIKFQNNVFYISEGYHRFFALLLLGERSIPTKYVRLEVEII